MTQSQGVQIHNHHKCAFISGFFPKKKKKVWHSTFDCITASNPFNTIQTCWFIGCISSMRWKCNSWHGESILIAPLCIHTVHYDGAIRSRGVNDITDLQSANYSLWVNCAKITRDQAPTYLKMLNVGSKFVVGRVQSVACNQCIGNIPYVCMHACKVSFTTRYSWFDCDEYSLPAPHDARRGCESSPRRPGIAREGCAMTRWPFPPEHTHRHRPVRVNRVIWIWNTELYGGRVLPTSEYLLSMLLREHRIVDNGVHHSSYVWYIIIKQKNNQMYVDINIESKTQMNSNHTTDNWD